MHRPSVLISGIGIAGPTLAWWLAERGCRPTLVERAPAPRTGGYVIDFWGLGYDVSERMQLGKALRAIGYDVRELRLVDARGRRVGGFGVEVFRLLTGGRYVTLPRGELARLLFEHLQDRCDAMFGDSITGLTPSADGVDVSFAHAAPRRFDIVVGADGLHSAVRRLAFPEAAAAHYLGYMVAAFEAQDYPRRDEGVYVAYARPGQQMARFAMRNGRTLFLLVFAANRPPDVDAHDIAAQKQVLHRVFGDAGWESRDILRALDACDTLYFDEVSQIRLPRWSRGRIALLGDAAFAPSLLAGQGAALAVAAAYVLAGELAEHSDQPELAFQRYEQKLRSLIGDKQRSAVQFARAFAPRTQLGLFIRNQLSRVLMVPGVARLALGRGLLDRMELPEYPNSHQR